MSTGKTGRAGRTSGTKASRLLVAAAVLTTAVSGAYANELKLYARIEGDPRPGSVMIVVTFYGVLKEGQPLPVKDATYTFKVSGGTLREVKTADGMARARIFIPTSHLFGGEVKITVEARSPSHGEDSKDVVLRIRPDLPAIGAIALAAFSLFVPVVVRRWSG